MFGRRELCHPQRPGDVAASESEALQTGADGDDPGEKAQARWIDAEKNTAAEIVGFECLSVLALTGDGKGGFLVESLDNVELT